MTLEKLAFVDDRRDLARRIFRRPLP